MLCITKGIKFRTRTSKNQMDFCSNMKRASRRLRFLVVLVITCLVSGFKLAVVVDEGGTVKSKSDTRTCYGGSTCVFEVKDYNFLETFTATPLPGYRFTKWQPGWRWMCPDQSEPTCTVSTSGMENSPMKKLQIESDLTVTLKPIFTQFKTQIAKTPALRYVVKDGTGAVLGNVTDFNLESVTVRLGYVDDEKQTHGFLLVFDNDSVAPLKSNTLLWDDPSCTGDAYMLIPEPYHFMEPLLSNDYQVINESPQANGIFSLVRIAPREEAKQLTKPFAKYGDVCQPWGGAEKGVPATIIMHDLGAVFKPPFGLFAE
jgi:hypothetical protein